MYSPIEDGSALESSHTGKMDDTIKSTGEDVARNIKRFLTKSYVTTMTSQTTADTRSVLTFGGRSGKKKAD